MQDKNFLTYKTVSSKSSESIELASELWLHIFSFLDPKSLLSGVQLTNKLFYQLANDPWVSWKNLFQRFFLHELPDPVPPRFDWQTAFKTLFLAHYGSFSPRQQKYIFLIATGAIEAIRAAKIPLHDLQADQFILIKTAAQFKQQAILDLFYAEAVDQIHSDKDHLYWATLCNQHATVDLLLGEQPDLINEAIFAENKTVTLLAALVGHLELMKKLITVENNALLDRGFEELYHYIVRSGQHYMVDGFNLFIKEHAEISTALLGEMDLQGELSSRITTAAINLPTTISLAASYGAAAIFKVEINSLHQRCIQLRERLESESLPSSSLANTDQDKTELPQLAIETESKTNPSLSESYEEAKSVFAWAIRTALMAASEQGHVNIVKYVLENHFFAIDQPLISQQTLLYRAAERNHLKLVKFLLENQADPELTLTMLLYSIIGLENIDYSATLALLVEAMEKKNKFSESLLAETNLNQAMPDRLSQECQPEAKNRLIAKRKRPAQEGKQASDPKRKWPRLEPSTAGFSLFTNPNGDIATTTIDSNVEKQQMQTTDVLVPRSPTHFFALPQSTALKSKTEDTKNTDFAP
ncbi:Ankyrin repeats (3 copies) [Legionella nautarum]|uniref:Ankyrin repeats (3 copies) n=1 Tax=Legionella nautarum TaxID=45070 RepID=A0A0W0WKI6_9GAMM|nr:ankyrin repeat domain-containing F-box protein [Legionella nautarum]KTD32843.1 Ankyrin repeats (3 copies) [Legionella nautarum]